MSWTCYLALLALIIMQSYVLYPASWKATWQHIKGKFGA